MYLYYIMSACVAVINVTTETDFNKLTAGKYVHVDGSTFTPFTKDETGVKDKDSNVFGYLPGKYFVVGDTNDDAANKVIELNNSFMAVPEEPVMEQPEVPEPVRDQPDMQIPEPEAPVMEQTVPEAAVPGAEKEKQDGGKSSRKSRKSAKKQRKFAKKQHKSAKKQRKSRSSRRSKK